jgi:hypothetical protein
MRHELCRHGEACGHRAHRGVRRRAAQSRDSQLVKATPTPGHLTEPGGSLRLRPTTTYAAAGRLHAPPGCANRDGAMRTNCAVMAEPAATGHTEVSAALTGRGTHNSRKQHRHRAALGRLFRYRSLREGLPTDRWSWEGPSRVGRLRQVLASRVSEGALEAGHVERVLSRTQHLRGCSLTDHDPPRTQHLQGRSLTDHGPPRTQHLQGRSLTDHAMSQGGGSLIDRLALRVRPGGLSPRRVRAGPPAPARTTRSRGLRRPCVADVRVWRGVLVMCGGWWPERTCVSRSRLRP